MWNYNDTIITNIEQMPEGAFGFVYEIHNVTKNKSYIGRKNLYFERKTALGKKEIAALESKRLKKWKLVVKESDWLTYAGSCKPLLQDIADGDKIVKRILMFVFSKRELTYMEAKTLFQREVLETDDYYNDNIESRYFRGNIK